MRKMTRRLELILFAYHWNRINSLRQQAIRLIDGGTPCSDDQLVTLSNQILEHGIKVSRIWRSRRNKSSPDTGLLDESSCRVPV